MAYKGPRVSTGHQLKRDSISVKQDKTLTKRG